MSRSHRMQWFIQNTSIHSFSQVTQDKKEQAAICNNLADTVLCQSQHLFIIILQLCTSINYCVNTSSALFKRVIDKALGRRQLSIIKMNSADSPSVHISLLSLTRAPISAC